MSLPDVATCTCQYLHMQYVFCLFRSTYAYYVYICTYTYVHSRVLTNTLNYCNSTVFITLESLCNGHIGTDQLVHRREGLHFSEVGEPLALLKMFLVAQKYPCRKSLSTLLYICTVSFRFRCSTVWPCSSAHLCNLPSFSIDVGRFGEEKDLPNPLVSACCYIVCVLLPTHMPCIKFFHLVTLDRLHSFKFISFPRVVRITNL